MGGERNLQYRRSTPSSSPPKKIFRLDLRISRAYVCSLAASRVSRPLERAPLNWENYQGWKWFVENYCTSHSKPSDLLPPLPHALGVYPAIHGVSLHNHSFFVPRPVSGGYARNRGLSLPDRGKSDAVTLWSAFSFSGRVLILHTFSSLLAAKKYALQIFFWRTLHKTHKECLSWVANTFFCAV